MSGWLQRRTAEHVLRGVRCVRLPKKKAKKVCLFALFSGTIASTALLLSFHRRKGD
jgi:hypothetical protein